MSASAVTQTYNSFSGVDMIVTFANTVVGEVQGVSYTVTREKAPLYTMGSANPRSFSRGKRGIAGSLIFLVFDRSALLNLAGGDTDINSRLYLKDADLDKHNRIPLSNNGTKSGTKVTGITQAGVDDQAAEAGDISSQLGVSAVKPTYHDQMPPFDVTISAANEYGHVCRMMVRNVEIMNAGSGMSIDDITTDESCTFVATQVIPWHGQGNFDADGNIQASAGAQKFDKK